MANFYVVNLNMKRDWWGAQGAHGTQTQTSSKMLIVQLIEGMFFVGAAFWRVSSMDRASTRQQRFQMLLYLTAAAPGCQWIQVLLR